jgi:hypothetical protein
MKPLAISTHRGAADAAGPPASLARRATPPAASSAARPAQRRAVGPPLAFAGDTVSAWADTQPGYHVRRFPGLPPEAPAGALPQV